MPQSNLSFAQRNLHGPVTSTPKNFHQVLITYTGCHHVIIYSTHNSKRQDGYGFIGENGYIFHESSHCIEVPIGGAYAHMFEDLLQVITTLLLVTSGGQDQKPVQTCSLEDPHTDADIWWLVI